MSVMTPERYSQVKSLFQLVLEQPAGGRAAFLERACGADRDLYERVRELVKSDSTSEDFLEKPAITPISKLMEEAAAEADEKMPATIGPYALQRPIGSGGMGHVYLAVRADKSYDKQVAIKVIRKGMETDRILQRFRRERQIVASLDHAHIARMLDGGATADGRPYFVMEYVDGHPIDQWCDQKRLPIEQRLRLFLQVCDAIHYAHQNLIIHRDIKPGNILVRPDGTAKLLDFGIAKLMNPELGSVVAERTATSMRMMTPQYASPEQVKGDAVTTASDVYLLGIVLYELLTGHRPYEMREQGTMEAVRAVSQGEPQRPSEALFRVKETLTIEGARKITRNINIVSFARKCEPSKMVKRLQGDLDAIALRALRRNPKERYQSAAQLAEDIRNHLAQMPVLARAQSPGYRFGLFLRRNKTLALAATTAVLLLISVAVFALWQASLARQQRMRAEARFGEVRKMSNALLFDVQDTLAPLPGTTPARRLLVQKALEYLSNLARESAGDNSLQRELAAGYLRVGHLQGNPNFANLGDAIGAAASYKKARELQERILTAEPKNTAVQNDLAGTLEALADMMTVGGDSAGALEALRKAVQLREQAGAAPAVRAASLQNLAVALSASGSLAEAKSMAQQAHQLAMGLSGADAMRQQAISHGKLATVLDRSGDASGAAQHFREAQQLHEKLLASDPLSARAKREFSFALEDYGDYLRRVGGDPGVPYQRLLRLRRELAVSDPQNVQARRDLAYALMKNGSADDALESFRQLAALDPGNVMARRDLALAHERAGSALLRGGKNTEAAAQFVAMVQSTREWAAKDPGSSYATHMLAVAQMKLADATAAGGVENARSAIALLDTLIEKEKLNVLFRRDRAVAQWVLGRTLLESKAWRESEAELKKARAMFEELGKQGQLAGEDRAAVGGIDAQLEACRKALELAGSVKL
jgi:non-specific serine/threonine protein kinase/serine/threonine-protein kinase